MKIASIFTSIDGEVNWWGQGTMSTFIRFAGCNLRCLYCDTQWAQGVSEAEEYTQLDVINAVVNQGCSKVTITGGEPLVQAEDVDAIVGGLISRGITKISIETNGSIIPVCRSPRVSWVVDYKLPSSGMMGRMMRLEWFYTALGHQDFIKFVILTQEDYEVARNLAYYLSNKTSARIAFSLGMDKGGVFPVITPSQLIQMLWKDELKNCIVNLQLHKLVGLVEDSDRGVPSPQKKRAKK